DANHTAMKALIFSPGKDQYPFERPLSFFNELFEFFNQYALNMLAFGIERVQFEREPHCLFVALSFKQGQNRIGVCDSPGGIDSRADSVAYIEGRDRFSNARKFEQSAQAGIIAALI